MSGDGPAGSTSDVACRDVLPEWPLAAAGAVAEPALFEPAKEGRAVAEFDGDACVPVPLPAGADPDWGPAAVPAAGADPAAAPASGAPGAGVAGGVPGTDGAEGCGAVADGVPEGGVLARGAVGSGLLGSPGSGVPGSGVADSGSVGSGLLVRDGGCDGVDSSEPADGEGLCVGAEPSRLSSTSSRPRVSEP
ncbi:hypothetical protein NicSoilB8_31830 [Arthrobacter sp. NicSoilB8]|nr:hypothetical protein NicSoilB8_31830 [Arthrobacter sp. NicSoilB8]